MTGSQARSYWLTVTRQPITTPTFNEYHHVANTYTNTSDESVSQFNLTMEPFRIQQIFMEPFRIHKIFIEAF